MLALACFLKNMKTVTLYDFIALIHVRSFSSAKNLFSKRNVLIYQSAGSFHSSCCTLEKKDIDAKRRSLLKYLEKSQREKIEVWRNISVKELAAKVQKHPKDLLQIMHRYIPEGHYYRSEKDLINDVDILRDVAKFFKLAPVLMPSKQEDDAKPDRDAYPRPPADPKDLVKRAPIVTIMGHVDHGKTTLLDYLRKANVVENEFGGITQHIGAFSVSVGDGGKVTFIDTPGHAAFSSMRARGANTTDIVVLVVAADDGVKPQTVESIRMAREAGATIIVAINKIDKPNADIKRTEEMLAQQELYTENMGGDVQAIPISALNGTNVDTLVEAILLQSEIMDLKSDPGGFAEGVILESKQDPHKGKLASAIIQRGTLRKGAFLVAGLAHAKVRLMFDASGQQISKAPPSTPVEMMGWKELPVPGDVLLEVESEKRAHQVLSYRKEKDQTNKALGDLKEIQEKADEDRKAYMARRREAFEQGRYRLPQTRQKLMVEDTTPKVRVIIKGDVDGSVEAILDVLETYHGSEVPLDIVHYGVGETTESDLDMASLFNAIIYCFNVKTPAKLKDLAKQQKISIRYQNVIYHLIDDIKTELRLKMPTIEEEKELGQADVIQQFTVNEKKKKVVVAGLRVTKGEIVKSEKVKLVRDGVVLFQGPIASLRHVKSEVNSMKKGSECGLMLEDSSIPVKLGDTIVCYKTVLVQKDLDWDPGF